MAKCNQCEVMVINGVKCHERGCPNETVKKDCFQCGFKFEAARREFDRFCPDCIENIYAFGNY